MKIHVYINFLYQILYTPILTDNTVTARFKDMRFSRSSNSNPVQIIDGTSINTVDVVETGDVDYLEDTKNWKQVLKRGTTGQRPSSVPYVGFQYFDTTNDTPYWWNGSNWVDESGAIII